MKKFFLTGARQTGKSTAIDRFLQETGLRPGGFRTRFAWEDGQRRLFLSPASAPQDRVLVAWGDAGGMHPIPGAFDRAGPAALARRGEITLLDELGFLEAEEHRFRAAVLSCLEAEDPVLGVLRQGFPGWTGEVARHRAVEVLTVTEENRDAVPLLLRQRLEGLPPISAVVMASGHARRFGGDKLRTLVEGVPMLQRLFQILPRQLFQTVAVVARDPALLELAAAWDLTPVPNDDQTNDTAVTIRLGLSAIPPDSAGCMFFVGDQPWLTQATIVDLCRCFYAHPACICLPVCGGRRGNPVLFPKVFFEELKNLPPHGQGRVVIRDHPQSVLERETEARELHDIDYVSDLKISWKS